MDAKRFEVTTVKVIFSLPSNTPISEVEKAASVMRQELRDQGRPIYDDSIKVESWDDEIRLWYVKEGK